MREGVMGVRRHQGRSLRMRRRLRLRGKLPLRGRLRLPGREVDREVGRAKSRAVGDGPQGTSPACSGVFQGADGSVPLGRRGRKRVWPPS